MTEIEMALLSNAIVSLEWKRLRCVSPWLRARLEDAICESERALTHAIIAEVRACRPS